MCELRNVTLKCGQGDCVRCYSTFNSLARHLRYEHSGETAKVSNGISLNDGIDVATSGSVDRAVVSVSCNESVDAPVVRDKSFGAASFVACLLSSSTVTERTVQCVIEHTSALVNDTVHDIANDVKNTMGSASTECEGLLSRIQQYASPFNAINSQYKRDTYFQKQYGMVRARSKFWMNGNVDGRPLPYQWTIDMAMAYISSQFKLQRAGYRLMCHFSHRKRWKRSSCNSIRRVNRAAAAETVT